MQGQHTVVGVLASLALPLGMLAPTAAGDGPGTIAWDPPQSLAQGQAVRGPWRMNDSDFRYVDDPSVAVNDAGVVAVVWTDQQEQDLYVQLFGPDGTPRHSEPTPVLGESETFSWLPRVVLGTGEDPDVFILWQEILFTGGSHGGEILFTRSTDAGASFEEPQNLSETPAGAGKGRQSAQRWDNGSLDLQRAPDGTLLAAWTEYEGRLHVAHSRSDGEHFSEPEPVVQTERHGPARAPSLAPASGERVFLAWTVGDDPGADLRIAASDDGGATFGEPRVVLEDLAHADAPSLLVDESAGAARVHLAYAESPDGPFGAHDIQYTRAAAADLDFADPRSLPLPEDAPDGAHAGFPELAAGPDGDVFALWAIFAAGDHRPSALALARLGADGELRVAPGIVPDGTLQQPGLNGSQQGLLMRKLAVGPDGALAVVNSRFDPGEISEILLVRGRPSN